MAIKLDTSKKVTYDTIPDDILMESDDETIDHVLASDEEYLSTLEQLNNPSDDTDDEPPPAKGKKDGDADPDDDAGDGVADADDAGSDVDDKEGDGDGGDQGLSEAEVAMLKNAGIPVEDGRIHGIYPTLEKFYESFKHKDSLLGKRVNRMLEEDPDAAREYVLRNKDRFKELFDDEPLRQRKPESEAETNDGDDGNNAKHRPLPYKAGDPSTYEATCRQFVENRFGTVEAQLREKYEPIFQEKGLTFSLEKADLAEIEEAYPALVVRIENDQEKLASLQSQREEQYVNSLHIRDKLIQQIPDEEDKLVTADATLLKERFKFADEDITLARAELDELREDPETRHLYFDEAGIRGSGLFVLKPHALYQYMLDPDRDTSSRAVENIAQTSKQKEAEYYEGRQTKPNKQSLERQSGRRTDSGVKNTLPTPEQMNDTTFTDEYSLEELEAWWDEINQLPPEQKKKYY